MNRPCWPCTVEVVYGHAYFDELINALKYADLKCLHDRSMTDITDHIADACWLFKASKRNESLWNLEGLKTNQKGS